MTKSEAEVAYKKAVQDWKNAKLEVETSEGADVQQTAAINKARQAASRNRGRRVRQRIPGGGQPAEGER